MSTPAIILAHPSAPVQLDPPEHPVIDPYRVTPETRAFSIAEAARERAAVAAAIREDELHRLEGIEALTLLVEAHGAKRVQSWLRNVAAMRNEAL